MKIKCMKQEEVVRERRLHQIMSRNYDKLRDIIRDFVLKVKPEYRGFYNESEVLYDISKDFETMKKQNKWLCRSVSLLLGLIIGNILATFIF